LSLPSYDSFAKKGTNVKKQSHHQTAALLIALIIVTSGISFGQITDPLICENATLLYQLWKDAAFGKDPNRTEKAAWVISSSAGLYHFARWRTSAARNSETWLGPIPEHAVALVHTHPDNMDEKPSTLDSLIAKKTGLVLYIISSRGIWSIMPGGQCKKEAGRSWHQNPKCTATSVRAEVEHQRSQIPAKGVP
jgi:hypothetical protein